MKFVFRIFRFTLFGFAFMSLSEHDNCWLDFISVSIFPFHFDVNKYCNQSEVRFLIYDFNEETVYFWGKAWGSIRG